MDHPDAAAEILNNMDVLQVVICCIREEKMAVAKQVMMQTLIYINFLNESTEVSVFVIVLRPSSCCLN